jgi:tetratricopeptide (TPR) repeat protein
MRYFFLFFLSVLFSSAQESDTAFISLGNQYYERQDFKKAIKSFEKATKVNPKSGTAFRLLGETYYRTVKLEEANDAFEKAIALDSTDNKSVLNLGISLARMGYKDLKKPFLLRSDSIYRRIIEKKYEVPYTYMLVAYNYAYRKDFSNCWKTIYKVREIDPNYVNMRFVVDLYVDHPDSLNIFNVQKTPYR